MDLARSTESIVKKQFTQAVIVADGFHVIRLVNYHCSPAGVAAFVDARHRYNLKADQKVRLLVVCAKQNADYPVSVERA